LGGKTSLDPSFFFSFARISPPIIGFVPKVTKPGPSHPAKSISTSAQYVTLDNKIKCLSLAVFSFGNPTNKTVTGTAYTWGTTNSKPQSLLQVTLICTNQNPKREKKD
jgi:hypothetical protein